MVQQRKYKFFTSDILLNILLSFALIFKKSEIFCHLFLVLNLTGCIWNIINIIYAVVITVYTAFSAQLEICAVS